MVEASLAIALVGLAVIFIPFFAYKILAKSSNEKAAFYVFWVGTFEIIMAYLFKVLGLFDILLLTPIVLVIGLFFLPYWLPSITIPTLKTSKSLTIAILSIVGMVLSIIIIFGSITSSTISAIGG